MDGDQFKCAMEAEEPTVEALEEIAAEKKRKSEEANARRREQEKKEAEEEARRQREILEKIFEDEKAEAKTESDADKNDKSSDQ